MSKLCIIIHKLCWEVSGTKGTCSLFNIRLEFRGLQRHSADLFFDGSTNILNVNQEFCWMLDLPLRPAEVVSLVLEAHRATAPPHVIGTRHLLLAEEHTPRLDRFVGRNGAQLPIRIDYDAFVRHPHLLDMDPHRRQGDPAKTMNRKKLPVVPPVHAPLSVAPVEHAPWPSPTRAPAVHAPQASPSRARSVHAPQAGPSQAPAVHAPKLSPARAPGVHAPQPSPGRAPAVHAPRSSTSRAFAEHAPRPSTSRRNSVPRAGPSSVSSDLDEAYRLDDLQGTIVQREQSMPRETVIDMEPVDESRTRKLKIAGKRLLRRGVPEPNDTVIDIPPPERDRKPFKAMRNLIRMGRARHRIPDEEQGLLPVAGPSSAPDLPPSPTTVTSSDEIHVNTRSYPDTPRKKRKTSVMGASASNKAADFQVCVRVIEARQLTGSNMDPVVCVQVGDDRKLTSVKESTSCPFYDEYFVFDFHEPPIILLDKIITLSVMHSRQLRTNKLLGTFKLDVATLWNQPDRQFYHKWALLTDPDDVMSGPKGYLKVDISVIGKGDTVKVPPKSEKDEDDIEANLLLPDGVTMERQRCRYIVNIHRADGLPKMNYSILANVKRAFTGESQDLVDPYVQVSFAGMSGQTTVKKNCCNPEWNEQIVFTEMFPPLCQRLKIQLRDKNPVHPSVIGTHFVDLKNISHDGETAGFLPTFGPSYIYFYGSTRDYSLLDQHSGLNAGMGEGLSYRARLLVSIRTEIMDTVEIPASEVEVEPIIMPINEQAFEKNQEFLLFASIFDVNMIDKSLTEKPIHFELSIGNAGNTLDGHYESVRRPQDLAEDLDELSSDVGYWQSTTEPMKASSADKVNYHLPYWDYKQCMHVRSVWPDHRRRMYNSNLIAGIIDKFEEGLSDAQTAADQEGGPNNMSVAAVKSTLVSVSVDCANYVTRMKSAPPLGNTKLDKEQLKLCISEMEQISALTRNLKARITKQCLKDRLRTAFTYLKRLKHLREVVRAQPSMPDIFIWMISNGKRLAYQRMKARDIIFAEAPDERGRLCAKIQTLFLKWPGKKAGLPSGWAIPAKLTIYAWLGVLQDKKHFIDGLPLGYEHSLEIKNHEKLRAHPPSLIFYAEKHTFQLRAYIYQARSLIGSDSSGLSDPYARVIIGDRSGTTQVIEQTLSPTWDELIVLDDVLIYGTVISIKANPPTIVVEIFDQDKVGKSEFIGRILAKPVVICHQELSNIDQFPPALEWFEAYRGDAKAGELLATFELLEIPPKQSAVILPALPQPKSCATKSPNDVNKYVIYPVPEGIRPTLSRYRLEVLFWGLRDLKRIHLLTVDKPRVEIECAGRIVYSTVIQNAKRNPNFANPIKYVFDVDLPDQDLYRPPLTIRVVDIRSFGRVIIVGSHTINSIEKYNCTPMSKRESEFEEPIKSLQLNIDFCDDNIIQDDVYAIENDRESCPLLAREGRTALTYGSGAKLMRKKFTMKGKGVKNRKTSTNSVLDDNESSKDWWTKYIASYELMVEEEKENKNELQLNESQVAYIGEIVSAQQVAHCSHQDPNRPKRQSSRYLNTNLIQTPNKKNEIPKSGLIKIYPHELEAVPEFEEFKEWLNSFELYRGKKTNDEPEDDNRVVGVFKGALKVYKWPRSRGIDDHTEQSIDPNHGFFQGIPNNDPKRVLTRVYVVKATDLHPMDLNGKADPYIVLKVGSKKISDKESYVSKQLNPVFGKCFEIEANFPQDSMLTIQVYDWDLLRTDELIGETKIDLENRYYSHHRAMCGLPKKYEEQGYNRWRDATKPTQILARLCKEGKLNPPIYEYGRVTIDRTVFNMTMEENELCSNPDTIEEQMALNVLLRWQEMPGVGCHLVPEHVETRSLYNPNKPGIEQGKLQMWVDMFPMDSPLPGPAVDISPRKPKSYELRVTICNTEDVVLEDDAFFTGEKMSDIYVKGWVKGPEDCQSTDIHYRSLTGEGNFNWRFIFPFKYLEAEERIVTSRKESLFSWDETECKIPARLELQVWDSDHFSLDDFLGAMTLDLNRFPRGAKSSKLCSLEMLRNDGTVPTVNLFKQKRIKGWWPFYIMRNTNEVEQTGKVEAEIHLLTQEEAERAPAGLGRSEPDPLDKPNRPDASFVWFLNPLRSIRYIAWQNYKKNIIKFSFVLGVALFIFLLFFNLPGYLIKKFLGA